MENKCPICKGTGFSKPGILCTCITRRKDVSDDAVEYLKEIFGMKDRKEG